MVEITADAVTVTDFDGSRSRAPRTPSTGTPRPPRRAATTASCSRRSPSSRRPSPTPCSAGSARTGELLLDEVRLPTEELREIDKIVIVACGTAYHAGLVAKYAIEHWTRIPVEVELASEFRYRDPVLTARTLVVAISQSGETMDTLMAVRHAREQEARVLAICNTNGSTIPRESDAVLYTHAGPEVAVASTKAFLDADRRLLPGGPVPGPGPRQQVRRRGRARSSRDLRRDAARSIAEVLDGMEQVSRARAASSPTRRRCCSSVGTSATRSRSRAR